MLLFMKTVCQIFHAHYNTIINNQKWNVPVTIGGKID